MLGIGVAAACLGFSSVAMADLITVEFDMAGTTVNDPGFVYGSVADYSAYAGYSVVAIGMNELVVDFYESTTIGFNWAGFIDASWSPGDGIWGFVSASGEPGQQSTYNYETTVPQDYGMTVSAAGAWGDWNMGTFIGSDVVGANIVSGSMYYILEGAPIPAPAVLAIFAVAGLGSRRRRK